MTHHDYNSDGSLIHHVCYPQAAITSLRWRGRWWYESIWYITAGQSVYMRVCGNVWLNTAPTRQSCVASEWPPSSHPLYFVLLRLCWWLYSPSSLLDKSVCVSMYRLCRWLRREVANSTKKSDFKRIFQQSLKAIVWETVLFCCHCQHCGLQG